MKTLLKLFALASGLFIFLLAKSQDVPSSGQDQQNIKTRGQSSNPSSGGSSGNSGTGIFIQSENFGKETSLYFNDWSPGKITLKDRSVLTDRIIRYNLLTQQMELIRGNDTAAIGNPDEIASIEFDGHKFVYREIVTQDNQLIRTYLEVLVEGKCNLLLQRLISHRYIESSATIMEAPKERYFLAENYFVAKTGNLAVPLPGKKKDIAGLLSEKDVRSYIREHKLNCEREEDLKALISFYNE
jgi:hypothetical protein